MDYYKHYNVLILRAQDRQLDPSEYYEKHHIIPKCIGGSDDPSNLVSLTGREHFIAHQLLVKMHPNNRSLAKAATMMCAYSKFQMRSQNRIYDWLRRRLSVAMSLSQSGDGNSQFGKVWIYNNSTQECKKITSDLLEEHIILGWNKGRRLIWNTRRCARCQCQIIDGSVNKKYCSTACKAESRGSMFDGREEELIQHYCKLGSLNKALKAMGLPGAMGGWYHQAKRIVDNRLNDPI